MNRPRKRFIFWFAPILWAATLFFLSAQSKLPEIAPTIRNIDKLEHVVAYGLLGTLVVLALRKAHGLNLSRAVLLTVLITSAYGATDEWHQYYVPNRSCDVLDWVADTFGGVLAAGVYFAYESRRSTKETR